MMDKKANLNQAFKDLRKLGYFARQNFWCCQSCAWAAVPVNVKKVVFYHKQDADELKETGEAVGCMGYFSYGESNIGIGENDVEIGYWVAKPYWNQGICTEAMRLMIDYYFNIKGFECLWSDFFIDNPASGHVMEKCGFRDTGKFNYCSKLYGGNERPVHIMKLDYAL